MKVSPTQLPDQLAKGLAPAYLVSGDEPLLVQEACDRIRESARLAGFTERKVFHADAQFDWRLVEEETQSLSLFAEQRRIEIRLGSGKPGKGRTFLEQFLAQPPEDVVLLLSGPRLDGGEFRHNWYKQLQKQGLHVQIWPVDADQFPRWLEGRCRDMGLTITRDALSMLCERVEGNLLAAHQELQRLRLISGDGTIDEATVSEAVLDSSRYNAFELSAEALSGQVGHALKMLATLRAEGANSLALLGIIQRDMKHVSGLHQAWQNQQNAAEYFKRQGIRQRQQQTALERGARRLTPERCRSIRELSRTLDRATKGYDTTTPLSLRLEELIFAIAH